MGCCQTKGAEDVNLYKNDDGPNDDQSANLDSKFKKAGILITIDKDYSDINFNEESNLSRKKTIEKEINIKEINAFNNTNALKKETPTSNSHKVLKHSQNNIIYVNNLSQMTFSPNDIEKTDREMTCNSQVNRSPKNKDKLPQGSTIIINNVNNFFNSFKDENMSMKDKDFIGKKLSDIINEESKYSHSLIKYPEKALVNKIEYNSNFDSNAFDGIDIVKQQQQENYNDFIERKKRRNESNSFNTSI